MEQCLMVILSTIPEGLISVDCSVDISYGADIAKAKEVLMAVLQSDKNVLKDPVPFTAPTLRGNQKAFCFRLFSHN